MLHDGDRLFDAIKRPKTKKLTGDAALGAELHDHPEQTGELLGDKWKARKAEREAEQRRQHERTRDLIERLRNGSQ